LNPRIVSIGAQYADALLVNYYLSISQPALFFYSLHSISIRLTVLAMSNPL